LFGKKKTHNGNSAPCSRVWKKTPQKKNKNKKNSKCFHLHNSKQNRSRKSRRATTSKMPRKTAKKFSGSRRDNTSQDDAGNADPLIFTAASADRAFTISRLFREILKEGFGNVLDPDWSELRKRLDARDADSNLLFIQVGEEEVGTEPKLGQAQGDVVRLQFVGVCEAPNKCTLAPYTFVVRQHRQHADTPTSKAIRPRRSATSNSTALDGWKSSRTTESLRSTPTCSFPRVNAMSSHIPAKALVSEPRLQLPGPVPTTIPATTTPDLALLTSTLVSQMAIRRRPPPALLAQALLHRLRFAIIATPASHPVSADQLQPTPPTSSPSPPGLDVPTTTTTTTTTVAATILALVAHLPMLRLRLLLLVRLLALLHRPPSFPEFPLTPKTFNIKSSTRALSK
jgi:hypothetical protein